MRRREAEILIRDAAIQRHLEESPFGDAAQGAGGVHVFTRGHQPATRYIVTYGYPEEKRHTIHHKPKSFVWTRCCQQYRWAKHCTVQVYYDMLPFWCRPGKGCKT